MTELDTLDTYIGYVGRVLPSTLAVKLQTPETQELVLESLLTTNTESSLNLPPQSALYLRFHSKQMWKVRLSCWEGEDGRISYTRKNEEPRNLYTYVHRLVLYWWQG